MTAQLNNTNSPLHADAAEAPFKVRVPIAIKLALAITLLIVGGMATLGFIILENQKAVLSQQISNMGSAIARQFASSSTDMVLAGDNLGLQTLANKLVDKQQIRGAIVISETGDVIVSSGTVPSLKTIQARIGQTEAPHSFEWSPNDGNPLFCFSSPIKFRDLIAGTVLVSFSKQQMIRSLEHSRFVILTITALMTLIAILIAFVMSRHLSRPIHNLVDASKAIGGGNYQYQLSERRNDEIGELACALNQMAKGLLKKNQVEDAFSRYVSSNVARKVLENLDEVQLGGKHVHASVLFADIVGFTSLSEKHPAEEITLMLNEYFSCISAIAKEYNGHIDKFMGDCAMLVFGVPEHTNDHSFNAVACAVMIRDTVIQLNEQRVKQNKIPIHFKIGVNTGIMVAGNLGSSDRMEYTVIGDPVNMASRLAGIADSDQIIVLEEFFKQDDIRKRVNAKANRVIQVRGKQDAVSTWTIKNIKQEYCNNMQQKIRELLNQPLNSTH